MARYYHDPVAIPPIIPDNPGLGVPSDHLGVFASPNGNAIKVTRRTNISKIIRPLPESLFSSFQQKITTQLHDFKIPEDISSTQIVENFQNTLRAMVCSTFPERKIWIN